MFDLTREMQIVYGRLAIVVNRLRRGAVGDGVEALRRRSGADCVIGLPDDERVAELGACGRSVTSLDADCPLIALADSLLDAAEIDAASKVSGKSV